MKRVGRFFVRLWFAHRNQAIQKVHKILDKLLDKRLEIILSVPEHYREGIVEKDPVLNELKGIAVRAKKFFETAGVNYEK